MDKLDKRILDLLQKDADLTAADIAERVGLSKAPCWRRIQRLRERGIIKRTVALLDARALNVGTTVFVTIKAPSHSAGAGCDASTGPSRDRLARRYPPR